MSDLLSYLNAPSIGRDILIGIFGLCVGSFLNVLALRSLQEKNPFWPPSHCCSCKHRLSLFDLIPLLSYTFLQGRCRYCKARISWQYPIVELATAIFFIVIVNRFGFECEGWGMLIFASTLIAICVTDFREMLIPHEITYPAMVIGLIYNGACSGMIDHGMLMAPHLKHDLAECMVGVGVSYMLFDFIAFYGIKFYDWMHRNDHLEEEEEEREKKEKEKEKSADKERCAAPPQYSKAKEIFAARAQQSTPPSPADTTDEIQIETTKANSEKTETTEDELTEQDIAVRPAASSADAERAKRSNVDSFMGMQARSNHHSLEEHFDPQLDGTFEIEPPTAEEEEPLEVMGGGDAVLGAVISAWLGVTRLGYALVVGFILGAFLGAVYLAIEMKKENILGLAVTPSVIFSSVLLLIIEGAMLVLSNVTQSPFTAMPWWQLGIFALVCGTLLGVVRAGSRVSKPFPFGPALVGGAIFAMFYDPFTGG